ncbi:MAG: hypothetical protein HFH68_13430 [Lachnospiraceae bacterium]|nr:hypothetical protein [Lachnospiraceae bacterium]
MAKYVSVKGWLECEYSQIKEIKKIIDNYKTRTNMGSIFSSENMEFYNKGWRYPEEIINWTAYVFYGADIKESYLEFIQDEIKEILKKITYIDGMFFFYYEEGEIKYWKIIDSKMKEEKNIFNY